MNERPGASNSASRELRGRQRAHGCRSLPGSAIIVLVVGMAAAGCAQAEAPGAATPAPTAEPQSPAQTASAASPTPRPTPTPVPTTADGAYVNPVLDRDFPDPDVLMVGDRYLAYSTNSDGLNIQVAQSTNLIEWEILGDALPELPEWAVQDFGWAWAPEVTLSGNGQTYLMYFTARFAIGAGGAQCIGVATSADPEGPFAPAGAEPLICPVGQGGAIDAASFVDDDGSRYLLWKNDGNSGGGTTNIYVQPISDDGLVLTGDPVALIRADQRWEGPLVEGPTLWKQAGRYFLLYSANDYASRDYAIGLASAAAISGPYQKVEGPFLDTDLGAGIVGPGGQDIVLGPDGDTWLLFHGWTPGAYRALYLAALEWEGGQPRVGPLTRGPMPAP